MLRAQGVALSKRVCDVSCNFAPGTITAICGPNGAGKSSLLELLAGLASPDAGEILLGDRPLASRSDRHKRLGYLPQTVVIAWDVTVRALVELGRIPHRDTADAPVDAALEALDLGQLAHRRAQTLSGGEAARVMLARVLAGEPDWIVADEPLSALDLSHQIALMRHLRRFADRGGGVVVVLHDLAMAMNWADRVLVLQEGALVADGPPTRALDTQQIERVWGVRAQWLGEEGARALVAV